MNLKFKSKEHGPSGRFILTATETTGFWLWKKTIERRFLTTTERGHYPPWWEWVELPQLTKIETISVLSDQLDMWCRENKIEGEDNVRRSV